MKGNAIQLNKLIKICAFIFFAIFMLTPILASGSEQVKIAYGILLFISIFVPSLLFWYMVKKSGKSFSENWEFAKNVLDNAPYDDDDLFNYLKGYYEDE